LALSHPALPKPMTVGDASVDYRPLISAGESTFVRLKISAAPELSSLKTEVVTKRTSDDPDFVYVLGPRLDLYPQMWAELQYAPDNFRASPAGRVRKAVLLGHTTVWSWEVTPTAQAQGRQDLLLHIGTVILPNDSQTELEVETNEGIRVSFSVQPTA